jgi:ribose 5-phosphate isomerase B
MGEIQKWGGNMAVIAIGCDHAGFKLKVRLKEYLESMGHEVLDLGTDSEDPVDYPDFVIPAAESVSEERAQLGIVIGGSGNGEAIAANKVKGIRCALCWSRKTARLAKQHNNANMISLGARMLSRKRSIRIVESWLAAEFEQGRHVQRLRKIADYEGNP